MKNYCICCLIIILSFIVCESHASNEDYYYFEHKGSIIGCDILSEQDKTIYISRNVKRHYGPYYSETTYTGFKHKIASVELTLPEQVRVKHFTGESVQDIGMYTIAGIGQMGFGDCQYLINLTLPSTITSIEEEAFVNCPLLDTVNVPSSVTKIKLNAFKDCNNFRCINIIDSGVSAGIYSSFEGILCKNKEVIFVPTRFDKSVLRIPGSTKFIGEEVFKNNDVLQEVVFEDGVEEIKNSAFEQCAALKRITTSKTMKLIGVHAFDGCVLLEQINISPGRTLWIEDCAFANCISLKAIEIPANVAGIEDESFKGCSGLEAVHFSPKSLELTYLSPGVFSFCTSLKEIKLPSAIKAIGPKAFLGCSELERVLLNDKLQEIGSYAFMGCSSLKNINVSKKIKIDEDAFIDSPITVHK